MVIDISYSKSHLQILVTTAQLYISHKHKGNINISKTKHINTEDPQTQEVSADLHDSAVDVMQTHQGEAILCGQHDNVNRRRVVRNTHPTRHVLLIVHRDDRRQ